MLTKNAEKRKDSVLWKTDKILAKNAEKRKDSVLWKTDKIVAKNAEKRKDSVLWKTDKIVAVGKIDFYVVETFLRTVQLVVAYRYSNCPNHCDL